MALLGIGEVARRAALRPSALRYYEAAGLLPRAARVSGQRRYDADILRRLDLLRFAQQAGFTLREIKTLLYGPRPENKLSERWQTLARKKLTELDTMAQRMQRMREALELSLQCGCSRVEECLLSPVKLNEPGIMRRGTGCSSEC
jgi:MerR family redox-sensitive transcriptional activator SoxR